ncbi:MAG: hypothetical protein INH37_01885, partial [Myxococcaceae bacterium]|nr:hypothetical protein [Myxococcaceae bacterium]
LLGGAPYDCIGDSQRAGMVFDDPASARPFVQEVLDIACRAASGDTFDYGTASINRDMRNHFLRNALSLGAIRPPKEAMQFFRCVAGMNQNLENLGASGPFRAVFDELFSTSLSAGRPLATTW